MVRGYGARTLVSVDDTAKILAGATSFFIYGYIEYSDTARKDHKIRFAYNFDWGEGGESIRFRPDGPDSYREYT